MQDHKTRRTNAASTPLPSIPDKLYFTIGEVSTLCDIKTHVLRYWEQEFKQLSPCKRKGNRRYYQRKDIMLVRQLKDLLYNQGFTVEGARVQLNQAGDIKKQASPGGIRQSLQSLQRVVKELEHLLNGLKTYEPVQH